MHQVRFAHPHTAIDEKRVVAARRIARYRPGSCVRELIAGTDHEVLKSEFRIQLSGSTGKDRLAHTGAAGGVTRAALTGNTRHSLVGALVKALVQAQFIDDSLNRKLQLPNRLSYLTSIFHFQELPGDLIRYQDPKYAVIVALQLGPHHPVLVRLRGNLGTQPGLDSFPHIGCWRSPDSLAVTRLHLQFDLPLYRTTTSRNFPTQFPHPVEIWIPSFYCAGSLRSCRSTPGLKPWGFFTPENFPFFCPRHLRIPQKIRRGRGTFQFL